MSTFVKYCHTCQLTGKPNRPLKPVSLYPIPVVGKPFEYLIMDCVGPLPKSKAGSNYLLTVMCLATRYPAAYPLRSITTKAVLKALTQFISVFGIPQVVQTDQGSNFTSNMFAQVLKRLNVNVRHNLASAYHAQSQGALERFQQTFKSLLRAYCTQMGGDWEEGLPWLLLAGSMGFSPNELVLRHSVRGPQMFLADHWKAAEPPKNVLTYVRDFRRLLLCPSQPTPGHWGHILRHQSKDCDPGW